MTGTDQFDSDPIALVEQELPTPLGEAREAWARTILTRLIEGGWDVVRRDESGAVTDVWEPPAGCEDVCMAECVGACGVLPLGDEVPA